MIHLIIENSLKEIPGSSRSTVEKTLIKDNADQGALLGAVSRTGHTRRHYKDLQEERDTPEPPLHSTKITSNRISMNSATSKPSYLPDSNAVTYHQDQVLLSWISILNPLLSAQVVILLLKKNLSIILK